MLFFGNSILPSLGMYLTIRTKIKAKNISVEDTIPYTPIIIFVDLYSFLYFFINFIRGNWADPFCNSKIGKYLSSNAQNEPKKFDNK